MTFWGGKWRGVEGYNSGHPLVFRGQPPGSIRGRQQLLGKRGWLPEGRWQLPQSKMAVFSCPPCVACWPLNVVAVLEGRAKGCAQRVQHQHGLRPLPERRFMVRNSEVGPGNFRKWREGSFRKNVHHALPVWTLHSRWGLGEEGQKQTKKLTFTPTPLPAGPQTTNK